MKILFGKMKKNTWKKVLYLRITKLVCLSICLSGWQQIYNEEENNEDEDEDEE